MLSRLVHRALKLNDLFDQCLVPFVVQIEMRFNGYINFHISDQLSFPIVIIFQHQIVSQC
jgi:hypothetical protein